MTPRAILADRAGGATVEFAFVAVPLFTFLVGLMELTVAMFVGNLLEGAMLQASRYGITGAAADGLTRDERVVQIVRENTFGFVDLQKAAFTTLVYSAFENIGRPEPFADTNGDGAYTAGEGFSDINGNGQWDADMGGAGLGGPGDIVVYRIEYTWGVVTPFVARFMPDVVHTSSIAVRNEPF